MAHASTLEEAVAIFHVARTAGVDTGVVLGLRVAGRTWVEILKKLHVSTDALYVPVGSPTTVFPGRAYDELRLDARKAWSNPDLCETDIVNLVNLKFISEYYGCRAEHVVALRSAGWSFAAIHADLGRPGDLRIKKTRRYPVPPRDQQ